MSFSMIYHFPTHLILTPYTREEGWHTPICLMNPKPQELEILCVIRGVLQGLRNFESFVGCHGSNCSVSKCFS